MDCYRVVLLQRPPSTPLRCLFNLRAVPDPGGPPETRDRLPGTITAILLKRPFRGLASGSSESLSSLAYLGLLTWNLVPQPADVLPELQSAWSSGFCESSLHQWRMSHLQPADENVWVLFHAIHLNTVVCIPDLQNLVVKYLAAQKSARSEAGLPRVAATPRECEGLSVDALALLFKTRLNREKAVWHATKVVTLSHFIAQRQVEPSLPAVPLVGATGSSNLLESNWKPHFPRKAPHFSHCVCFSILTLWGESLLANRLNVQESKKWLEKGIEIVADGGDGHGHGHSHIEAQFRGILLDLHRCAVDLG